MVEVNPCRGRCTLEQPCSCQQASVHRRNVSTMASPVVLVFEGFHHAVYQVFLASRYLLAMALLLLRYAAQELMKPSGRATQTEKIEPTDKTASCIGHIIENKLAALDISNEMGLDRNKVAIASSYKEEAENCLIQHQVNNLKQHHRRAFDLISMALKIDEEVGSKDGRTVEMYKQGINELEKGIMLDFGGKETKESLHARKLQHKMKLNLDMAKKRLEFHRLAENKRTAGTVGLRHLSLPRNCKPPTKQETGAQKVHKREKSSTYTPPPTRRYKKEGGEGRRESMSGYETLPRNYRTRSSSASSGTSSKKGAESNKFMKIIMDEIIEEASCSFCMVAGQDSAKQALQETVILPALRPELFTGLRTPTRGLLLFGPPGCGKTLLARAVASESESAFFNISASTLTSKFLGEGEKLVRALFTAARQTQPSIIFIDEIDSLLCERSESEHEASRRLKTEFLLEFDGLRGQQDDRVLVMGATNRPQDLDDAVLRRFSKRIYVRLPCTADRSRLVQQLLGQQYNELSEREIHQIAQLTSGYSGSDLAGLARDAAYGPIRELKIDEVKSLDPVNLRKINMSDFLEAMKRIKKSVSADSLLPHEAWNQKFGEGAS